MQRSKLGEQHFWVLHGFDLEHIMVRVGDEEGFLLVDLAFEAAIGFVDIGEARVGDAAFHGVEIFLCQMDAKMRDEHRAHINIMADGRHLLLALVEGQLVAPEVHIDPAPLFPIAKGAAENIGVEFDCGAEIASRNSEVNDSCHGVIPILAYFGLFWPILGYLVSCETNTA